MNKLGIIGIVLLVLLIVVVVILVSYLIYSKCIKQHKPMLYIFDSDNTLFPTFLSDKKSSTSISDVNIVDDINDVTNTDNMKEFLEKSKKYQPKVENILNKALCNNGKVIINTNSTPEWFINLYMHGYNLLGNNKFKFKLIMSEEEGSIDYQNHYFILSELPLELDNDTIYVNMSKISNKIADMYNDRYNIITFGYNLDDLMEYKYNYINDKGISTIVCVNNYLKLDSKNQDKSFNDNLDKIIDTIK